MLIDTHCHLDFPDFDPDRSQVIQRANEAGVARLISIGTTLETSRAAIALADSNPQIFATVGLHPCEVQEASDSAIDELAQLAEHPKVVAIGECGLDYHRLPSKSSARLHFDHRRRISRFRRYNLSRCRTKKSPSCLFPAATRSSRRPKTQCRNPSKG